MNNENQSPEVETKIKASKWNWIIGIVFLISGLGSFSSSFLSGLLFSLGGLILLPPVADIIKKKYNYSLSRSMKVLLIIFVSVVGGVYLPSDTSTNSTAEVSNTNEVQTSVVSDSTQINNTEKQITPDVIKDEVIQKPEPKPVETVKTYQPTLGERNAVLSAKQYLGYAAFSKSGLIEQLEYEGYSSKETEYAISQISVDWNQQAALAAKAYLEYSAFSRSSLIEQLEYDGFTHSQAECGVSAVGY